MPVEAQKLIYTCVKAEGSKCNQEKGDVLQAGFLNGAILRDIRTFLATLQQSKYFGLGFLKTAQLLLYEVATC